ncbi:deoxyribonuclease IV [Cellulosilyticum sp. I15G10I2]|uniref:deoxyribonuclease IV n=1 Tax=Cellulosilyticum sp. I15G10I2 TaxID=1892843 RepID=UPI00085BB215|nr:deoxyribonuclease IV [Cellulosilyticum sp. I15G10I2]
MLKIGSHVSISGGLLGAAKEAHSYGANTFMVYTGAPQNTRRKPIENLKIEEGHAFMSDHGLSDIVVHAPYIINLASSKKGIYQLAKEFLALELERTAQIGANYLVLHPGSFTDKTYEYGIERISSALNDVLREDIVPVVCLETMAGKGTEIGRSFKELKDILDRVELKSKIGICFDTCHTHDSGYDIIHHFDEVLEEFDSLLGLDKLKVFHINGSLNTRGAKKDRHANLGASIDNPRGQDFIGKEALYQIVHHPVTDNKPVILETPWLDAKTNLYKEEIAFLRG